MKFGPNGELPPCVKAILWDMPLVLFVEMMGVKLTPAQSLLIGSWLERHNSKMLELCKDHAERAAIQRRFDISQN